MQKPTESLFEARRRKALELLGQSGIRKSNYQPPITSLLWKLGIKVPPPHFANFASVALANGLYFGLVWGTVMSLTVWSHEGRSLASMLTGAAMAGALFGISMAAYYAYGRKKHQLPAWKSLSDERDEG
jgi:hypothetical protein